MRGDEGEDENETRDVAGAEYFCAVCLRLAPPLDSTEILAWQGGEQAMAGEDDPLKLELVCPAHAAKK